MPNRLDEWQLILKSALNKGYTIHSVKTFSKIEKQDNKKYLIIRHDIDTDTSTARKLWELEKKLKITNTSYYFRRSTIDINLMKAIEESGGEASYHYEELATFAKRAGLASKIEVLKRLNSIQNEFKENISHLRQQSSLEMSTVASHGDWMNRKLDITNSVILEDRSFRKDVGVEIEAYDQDFMKFITSRHADAVYPKFWSPENPMNAIERGEHVIYILIHPRQWRSNIIVNMIDNLGRIFESINFYIKSR